MELSNKLEATVQQHKIGNSVSSGIVEKCLDDNEAIFDDILSSFVTMFNKREYGKVSQESGVHLCNNDEATHNQSAVL